MIKRISLVWKRDGLGDAEFRRLWLGMHAEQAKRLIGARSYVIDFLPDAGSGSPSAIATLLFDDARALERAFADAALVEELTRSRETFASRVEVFLAAEEIVIPKAGENIHD